MTDELISCLMTIGALRVASRTSIMTYRDTQKSLPQIARELQVGWIVEGSVLQWGSRVRITAHLIEAPTDRQIWGAPTRRMSRRSSRYRGGAPEIARAARVTLTSAERSSIATARRVDPAAYDAYCEDATSGTSGPVKILVGQPTTFAPRLTATRRMRRLRRPG